MRVMMKVKAQEYDEGEAQKRSVKVRDRRQSKVHDGRWED
jgi:hypothetical protein